MTARAAGLTDVGAEKAAWRRRIRAARRARTPETHARQALLITEAALELADRIGGPICAYLPTGAEPWSVAGVEVLCDAGHEVLLPVVADRTGPLEWAVFGGAGALAEGPFGLWEPTGPRLGPQAVSRAHLVLLPALAADRHGVRLGQGGGFYDRTLPLADPDVALVVVLDDDELVDTLPAEPHDRRVDAAILPGSGVTMLGNTDRARRGRLALWG